MKLTRTTTENLRRDLTFITDIEDAKSLEEELSFLQEQLKSKKRTLLGQRRKLLDSVPPAALKELTALYKYLTQTNQVSLDKEVSMKAVIKLTLPNLSNDYLLELADDIEEGSDFMVYDNCEYSVEMTPKDLTSKLVLDHLKEQHESWTSGESFDAVILFDEFESAIKQYCQQLQRFQQVIEENKIDTRELFGYLDSQVACK